jgi:hypothetical protein
VETLKRKERQDETDAGCSLNQTFENSESSAKCENPFA